MSYQKGRGNRPPRRPNSFNPHAGGRLPDCSQASGWNSKEQIYNDYYNLLLYVDGESLDELWKSSRETADDAYRKLKPVVTQVRPQLLNALKRLYCSRKNKQQD